MKSSKSNQILPTEVKIPPFSRIAWRDGFQEKHQVLQRWAEEFNRAELSTVVNKIRECGIYLIEAAKYQEECLNFNKTGLVFLPVQKNVPNPAWSFSSSEEARSIRCVVSYSEEKAQELAECLQSGGINCAVKIGKLLGYPSCCVDFLNKYSASKNSMDPIFTVAKKTKGMIFKEGMGPDGKGNSGKVKAETVSVNISPEINIILRNFGVKAVPHIPCSFSCEKSREFSKNFLKFMPSKNSLLEFLSEPMTWNEYKGIAIINTKWFEGATQSIFHDDKIYHIINFNKN